MQSKSSRQLYLVSGGNCCEIIIWHLASCSAVRRLSGESASISSILVNKSLNKIIVSCYDRSLSVYQLESNEGVTQQSNGYVNSMCVFGEEYMVFSTGYNKIEIWDSKTVTRLDRL